MWIKIKLLFKFQNNRLQFPIALFLDLSQIENKRRKSNQK